MGAVGRVAQLAGCLALLLVYAPVAGRGRFVSLCVGAASLVVSATCLVVALVRFDGSLVYVADTVRRDASWWWRAAALWSGSEGSLLAFAAVLGAVAVFDARRGGVAERVSAAPVLGVAMVSAAVANPFRTLDLPATDGAGLTPILEHPAMLVHPPLTYLGFAALVIAAARAAGTAGSGAGASWSLCVVRRTLRFGVAALTVAMALGARWAYVELGWGGWWAWDAVENASLLPWLAAVAALHGPVDGGGDGTLRAGAVTAGVLVLAGGALARGGAASSVHAFAEAEAIGRAVGVLAFAGAVAGTASLVRAGRTPRRARSATVADGDARARAALAGGDGSGLGAGGDAAGSDGSNPDRCGLASLLLGAVTLVVAVGTLAPVWRRLAGEGPSSTSGHYFAVVTTPLVWALLIVLIGSAGARVAGGGPRGGRFACVRARQVAPMAAIVVGGAAVSGAACGWADATGQGVVTGALAGAAAVATAVVLPHRAPMGGTRWVLGRLAHLGVALLVVGAAAGTGARTSTVALAVGERATVGGVTITSRGASVDPASPMERPEVRALVEIDGTFGRGLLTPRIVGFPDRGVRLAETATRSTVRGDVQLGLLRAADDGRVVLSVHRRPLVWLVWLGAGLLALATLLLTPVLGPVHVE